MSICVNDFAALMRPNSLSVFIFTIANENNPDEIIELLTSLGYKPTQHQVGGYVRAFSVTNMSEEDMIFIKLVIPSVSIYA